MEQPLPAADSYGVKDSAWFEDVFTKFPRLHHLLSDKVKARLLRLESELAKPFVNDLDYLEDVEVSLLLKRCEIALEELLISQELSFHKESKVAKEECLEYIKTLETLRTEFEASTLAKLRAHVPYVPRNSADPAPKIEGDAPPLLPRLVRLAEKLDLVDKEKRALEFIIVSVIGQEFGKGANQFVPFPVRGLRGGNRRYYSFESLLRYSNMSISEGISFLRPARIHLTQGLFSVDKVNPMLNDYLEMPHETVAVITGTELTATELLKIDKTKLHELVEEEDDYAKRAGKDGIKVSLIASGDAIPRGGATGDDAVPIVPPLGPPGAHAWMMAPVLSQLPPGLTLPEGLTLTVGGVPPEKVDSPKQGTEEEKEIDLKPVKGDVFEFLRHQRAMEKTVSGLGKDIGEKRAKPTLEEFMADDADASVGGSIEPEEEVKKITPYKTDIEYLDDQIKWISTKLKVSQLIKQMQMNTASMFGYSYGGESQHETQLRELRAKERMLKAKCQRRLELTRKTEWLPRLERLAIAVGLDEFEKIVLLTLVAGVISQDIYNLNFDALTGMRTTGFTVGGILQLFCKGFEGEIRARPYFYKAGTLVREGIIRLSEKWGDLMNVRVELDRRMLDFIVGLDTEFTEMVEGSHSYFPKVDLGQVVLPEDAKKLMVDTVEGFEAYKKFRKDLGFEEIITYGNGVLLMFFGPSGTGKTMMANALGNHLGKKILLINYTSLGGDMADEVIKFIFREAKLTDSILFFDECEQIFLSREKGGREVNLLLTEIERHDGLIIMATNRAFDLDEAMHRRITLAIEFRQPDPILRQKIWQSHIPKNMKVDSDIDWKALALKYELSGGFIKNAVLSALSAAVNRDKENPVISQHDLEQGSKLQLRGRLRMIDFDRRVVPTRGIEDFIGPESLVTQLQEIVNFEKARQVLFGQWGYSEKMCNDQGTTALFYGHPGVGKTLAAEVVGFETGKPLKVINCAELVSKYVGETGKNIEMIFKEARTLDCILVFDEAESLFGARSTSQVTSTDRYANMDTGILLYHMEKFPGIVVLTTNLMPNIDSAFYRRLRFMVEFPLPDAKLREKLWKANLPPNAPLADDVDLGKLASLFSFAGGNIKNACFKAAARAALRIDNFRITMDDLMDCAQKESEKGGDKLKETHLYS